MFPLLIAAKRLLPLPPRVLPTTIKVEQEDIDLGVRGNVNDCAFARALRREGYQFPTVGLGSALVHVPDWFGKTKVVQFRLTNEAVNWMSRFDKGRRVEPFVLQLN